MVQKYCNQIVERSEGAPESSMYHLVSFPVRVRWNNLIESSIKEFDKHHKWKVVTWSPGSSPVFPSNLGISEGSLVGTGGQTSLYLIRSLVNLERYGKFNVAKKGSRGGP